MNTRFTSVVFLVLASLSARPAMADPCGMVPPIYPGEAIPLARVGLQQTYVFYKEGVETFVIRPGFTGKVDEFGMLIPFPTPPAIRKVPDHIFGHLAAAVDPPEVVVDLRPQFYSFDGALGGGGNRNLPANDAFAIVKESEVRVLREEAVGMYEVAVLAAGSAKALKRWLDDHGYKYPDGMDKPCNDYVKEGWCFVAVKTKVAEKNNLDPKPGQRTVNPNLPAGSTFDGHVQGMGFRFKVDDLVVPMRLSAFNKGELRNIVYLLTDEPKKIRMIPEEYVVRQISGEQLINNIKQPLPIRIIDGTAADIPEPRRKSLVKERDPVPHSGAAKDLFASDLLSVSSDRLALPHEEREKELLRIGERFGLRGTEIDKLNEQGMVEIRKKAVNGPLDELKSMTLTVIDGDFPRELLANRNLTFAQYKMPSRRNKATTYDAKTKGPAAKQPGVLHLGSLDFQLQSADEQVANADSRGQGLSWLSFIMVSLAVSIVFIGLARIQRNKSNEK